MRYVAIRSEGGLLPYDLLDKIVADQVAGQKPADFGLPKGQRLVDEISRVWADAQNLWSNFKRRRQALTERDPYGTSITRSWIVSLLSDPEMMGFDLKLQASAVIVNNVTFAISHRNGVGDDAIPVHVEGCKIDLDRRLHTKLRTSPQAMLQDFLNNSEDSSWGILTNGVTLRLLRDSSRTSRPTYLEFDLESILEGNRFNEFALLYRLCHRSRFPQPGHEPSDCLLEHYYQESLDEGARVRERLRDGVEDALKILGTALLRHPENAALREKSASKEFWPQYHRQLLLLVYRLLFLMVAEERGLIVSLGDNAEHDQKIYDEWYSIARLRNRASQIVEESPFGDLWQGLQRTFSLFEYGLDANPLGIPPLNGDLFDQKHAIPDLTSTELYNHDLLLAVRRLSIFKDEKRGPWVRVNYSHLDVEELGSVYESLLDYQPVIHEVNHGPAFELSPGMERKKTGSYYTRPELVHELIESALVPVMQERLAKAEKETEGKDLITEQKAKEKALLDMSVCDPACGSGHFLLAAARRLGKELARIRTSEDEPKPGEFHLAVRDVISHCIYGVDLNPLAVDLCKVALWLEGHWAGKPLSFLDHRIRCGNSLIGVLDPGVLEEGIPDDAFTAVAGDDKKVAAFFKKRNKQERTSRQRGLAFEADDHTGEYAASNRELRELSENTAADVRRKAQMYSSWRAGMQYSHDEAVADLWTAQFFLPLSSTNDPAICMTKDFLEFAVDKNKKPQQVAAAQQVAQRVRFFHWHLEFPDVLAGGGFDVILGNPPWDSLQPEEVSFFASRGAAGITKLSGAKRKSAISALQDSNPDLFEDWMEEKRRVEAANEFIRRGGQLSLAISGKLNTYSLFAELALRLHRSDGCSGVLVPSGIALDETNSSFVHHLTSTKALQSFFDFENREGLFADIDSRMRFAMLTTSRLPNQKPKIANFLTRVNQIQDSRRVYSLTPDEILRLNPSSGVLPIFRTVVDYSLTIKLYSQSHLSTLTSSNPWKLELKQGLFNMTSDSHLFGETCETGYVPLYEGKMVQAYDHRASSVIINPANLHRQAQPEITPEEQHRDIAFEPTPHHWVESTLVDAGLGDWKHKWIIAFKDVTAATNERTAIAMVIPRVGAGHNLPLVLFGDSTTAPKIALFLANVNALCFDYIVRQKIGGNHLTFGIFRQLPFVTPHAYRPEDESFIADRVLRLVYTCLSMRPFAEELSVTRDPFIWDLSTRAQLRAELDAYYAHLYGLTRDELRYILDPKEVFGEDFPSETFRVLKEHEIKEHGEYRTQRLVLEAFDELAKSDRFRDEMPKRVSAIEVPARSTTAGGRA